MSDKDTEVLLVSLISLLGPEAPGQSELLNALVDCDGDVEAAVQLLQSSTPAAVKPSNKRKRPAQDLDGWVLTHAGASQKKPTSNTVPKSSGNSSKVWPVVMKRVKPASVGKKGRATSEKPRSAMDNPATSVKPQSAGGTPSNVKTVDLTSVLRAPPSEQPNIIRNPPLTLSNPVMVAQHTPCTLHYSILPPELACELFYTMLDAAQGWSRNKWWLFDRLVESPHRTSFFARIEGTDMGKDNEETWKEEAQFWYNGRRTDPPHPFPEEMEAACRYVEKAVNQEISKRIRFPLEWGGPSGPDGQTWRANVAAANCYEGTKEGVGFHSDQLTNLGPYPTIASISLGTTRLFRLREVIPSSEADKRQARTYNIPLPHNSLIVMHASTQERFKHCVPQQSTIDVFRPPFPRRPVPGDPSDKSHQPSPHIFHASHEEHASSSTGKPRSQKKDSLSAPSHPEGISSTNCRINITFRFYRPDFASSTTPRCRCGVPCILRPDMKSRVDRREANIRDQDFRKSGKVLVGIKGKEKERISAGFPSKGSEGNDDRGYHIKYWWTCYAGAQNEGKGCGMWRVMDLKTEGRGPFVGDLNEDTVEKAKAI